MTTIRHTGPQAIVLYYGPEAIAWLPGESRELPAEVADLYLTFRPALFERIEPAPVAEEASHA